MIRLCEGKIIKIDIAKRTVNSLISYIEESCLENFVYSLYDGDTYLGDYIWDDILVWKDFSGMQEGMRIQCGEDIFAQIRASWGKNPSGRENGRHLYAPIYDEQNNLLCVAFDDAYEKGEHNNDRNSINYFKMARRYQTISLLDIFPDISCYRLHGVNEIQYVLYEYLKQYNIPYQLVGEQWRILGNEKFLEEQNKNFSSHELENVYDIYADRISPDKTISDKDYYFRDDFLFEKYYCFALELGFRNYINEIRITAKEMEEKGVVVGCVKFPDEEELGQTENEDWCFRNQLSLHFFHGQTDFRYLQNILEVYGEELVGQHKRGITQEGRYMQIVEECNLQSVTSEKKKNRLLLIGPCVVRQEELMTDDILVAQLQKKMDEKGYDYRVEGLTIPIEKYDRMKNALETMYFREGDMILFCNMYLEETFSNYYLDLLPLLQTRQEERWFTDSSLHLNQKGTAEVAAEISRLIDKMQEGCIRSDEIRIYPSRLENEKKKWISSYIERWQKNESVEGSVGAIVMNCNPYTKGHDHLIRYAASQVDHLYIFVVEEDVSLFSFKARYEMVKRNTEDISNVEVLPSGKAILSMMTFPTYFSKGSFQDVSVDASTDISFFALGIAPGFHITKRFVGEEPKDNVTAQYNECMKRVLPHYGIEVVEIPRLEMNGMVVSASKVRESIKNGNIEALRELLTEKSFSFLMGE